MYAIVQVLYSCILVDMTVWFTDPPAPKPPRQYEFIANHIKFIAAQFNGTKFYISAADDEPTLIPVHL